MLIICGDLERLQKAHRMALSGEYISIKADKVMCAQTSTFLEFC